MRVDITSMFFNSSIDGQTATPAWRTSLGQNKTKACRIETDVPGVIDIVVGMTYKIVGDISKLNMTGISGNLLMCSVFDKIYVNSVFLSDTSYTLLLLRETSQSHEGRVQLCYSPHIVYNGKNNGEAIDKMRTAIGCKPQGCWFVYDISIKNQDELHFSAKIVDSEKPKVYSGKSQQRSQEWKDLVNTPAYTIDELASILGKLYKEGKRAGEGIANVYFFGLKYADCILSNNYKTKEIVQKSAIGESFQTELDTAIKLYALLQRRGWASVKNKSNYSISSVTDNTPYLPYLTALRTKPFMLLAGISGTGKSRIVREMAKACWASGEEDYGNHCPRNFCMVQVKPNWHDSSELIGYVSRINGEKYIVGPFLRFIAQALKEPHRPYFLCLDEMNLAPVEQYFAEFLSVIESRKLQDGQIVTDPIVPYENTEAYGSLIDQLFESDEERKTYKTEKIEEGGKRLTIPQNLFVVGTVNMDETTFSFSRKVLDRAMTIEMNDVKLKAGLDANSNNELGYISSDLIGQAVEGGDIYADNQPMCDEVIAYLERVNEVLDGTPFKIAYRTRNEFLLYAVNRKTFAPESELWQTLDEMTSMKILSRIEGDTERCEKPLRGLEALLKETLGDYAAKSISLRKIEEMTRKLQSGYTSYWT